MVFKHDAGVGKCDLCHKDHIPLYLTPPENPKAHRDRWCEDCVELWNEAYLEWCNLPGEETLSL